MNKCTNPDCSDGWIITEMSASRNGVTYREWLDREPCRVCRVHSEGDEIEIEEASIVGDEE